MARKARKHAIELSSKTLRLINFRASPLANTLTSGSQQAAQLNTRADQPAECLTPKTMA
jgi:hypothetical protein